MFRQPPVIQFNRSRRERGYTLIELSVVMMILAIVAAFVVPQVIAYMRMYRLGVGGRNVATALQRARFLATSNNTRAGIFIPELQRVDIEQYDPEGKAEPTVKGAVQMPQGVTIASDAPKQIAFDGRGVVTPMPKESPSIRINGASGYYLFVTISPTGQVTVSEARREEKS
jgi:prepilin-type N-terminal cleavage/methylation domain-containing protein